MNELIKNDQLKSEPEDDDYRDNNDMDTSKNGDHMVVIPLGARHQTEDYSESPAKHDAKSKVLDQQEKKPRFDISMVKMDSHRLQLPEESKDPFEFRGRKLKIDFSNDPVMKSLLENKQDQ